MSFENRPSSLATDVQAHLLRASKFAGGHTRNWSLFLFFRVMAESEVKATFDRFVASLEAAAAALAAPSEDKEKTQARAAEALEAFRLDMAQPTLAQAGLAEQRATRSRGLHPGTPAPSKAFRNWLKIIVNHDRSPLTEAASSLGVALDAFSDDAQGSSSHKASPSAISVDVNAWRGVLVEVLGKLNETDFPLLMTATFNQLKSLANNPKDKLVLPMLLYYEFLRQVSPALAPGATDKNAQNVRATVRSEANEPCPSALAAGADKTPINIAFTHAGLAALRVHPDTLASFPDAFREGMAARARRLADIGPSAPEHWEGELGQACVHGYFTGGFGAHELGSSSAFWRKLREEIRAFNGAVDKTPTSIADSVREQVQILFRLAGMELLHIELGQDPSQEADDAARHDNPAAEPSPRREHFGFRDGLSQPFVDLDLGDTLPGGGSPDRQSSWTPAAKGELFLDASDEDGEVQATPVNRQLRKGSTYLVFRKLEQDVPGLRSFVERQHPRDEPAQRALEAQFVGRWPDGAPLVLSPYDNKPPPGRGEAPLNDFRYAADDPEGARCPLGAHIRRANPRDIGGRSEVRHHRILRRGISYGGPMLPLHSMGDGEPRGLLFIAANARIDLQFEVVQGEWLNGGEFLGQAGLARCPLTGSNAGATADRFLPRGAVAPITGLPSFVTLRGGDYFFAPGLSALKRLAQGGRAFAPDTLPYNGFSMADARTPTLFDGGRLQGFGERLVKGQRRAIVVQPPNASQDQGETVQAIARKPRPTPTGKVAFVGRHQDVTDILSNTADANGRIAFSVSSYLETGRAITRGHDLLIGTENEAPTAGARKRLVSVLEAAWTVVGAWLAKGPPVTPAAIEAIMTAAVNPTKPGKPGPDPYRAAIDRIVGEKLEMALRTAAGGRRLDLIADFASQAAYGVTCDLLGLRGPDWVTEMAPALAYSKQHVGALPADWLTALQGQVPADPGFTTMRLWTSILVADLIGNVDGNSDLKVLSRQAGTELLNHIDLSYLLMGARVLQDPAAYASGKSPTLLTAFVALEANPAIATLYADTPEGESWQARYRQDVAMILLEIAGSTLAVIPLTFAHVMEELFDKRIDLSRLLGAVNRQMPLSQIVYEAERLNPNMPVRMRFCQEAKAWPATGDRIEPGDAVAALISAANMDGRVFTQPHRFHLKDGGLCPMGQGGARGDKAHQEPKREERDYLLFGVAGSAKYCWGASKVAMPVLESCVAYAGRLQGLRRVAGPRGEAQTLAGVTIGLQARFSRVLTETPRKKP